MPPDHPNQQIVEPHPTNYSNPPYQPQFAPYGPGGYPASAAYPAAPPAGYHGAPPAGYPAPPAPHGYSMPPPPVGYGMPPPPTGYGMPAQGGYPAPPPAGYSQNYHPQQHPQNVNEQGAKHHNHVRHSDSSGSSSVSVPVVAVPVVVTILGADGKPIDPTMHVNSNNDRAFRMGFIKKVYGILATQLLITFGLALCLALPMTSRNWLYYNFWLCFTCLLLFLVLVIVMCCFPGVGRRSPINYILLVTISLLIGVVIATCAAGVSLLTFLAAMGITFLLVLTLTAFAFQSRWDFTGAGPYLAVVGSSLLWFGLFAIIFRSEVLFIMYASIGACLFSLYIIADTQMIVGGKHRRYQFSIDDYAFAALSLYMDIINLFLMLLALLSNG